MLGPQHVGSRVVVRRMMGVRDDRPVYSDILGHLVEVTETHLTVRGRGGAVRVPHGEIFAAKQVPDRRRLTPTESLEVAAAFGWPPAEREHLGDWVLRATDGWTMRGNSTLTVGEPDLPTEEAIDAVTEWYTSRNLPPAMSVPLPLFQRIDLALERRGWTAMPLTLVMTARLADLPTDATVTLATAPSPEWLTAVAGRKGPLPPTATAVLTGVTQVRFAEVYDDRGLVATGRGCVADPDGRWLGLSLLGTDERARRQGLAQRVVGGLAGWARSVGATDAYLQVEQRNVGAVALYEKLGFTVHHVYTTRRLLSA